MFSIVGRSIRNYSRTEYLVLFDSENIYAIFNGIRHLISLKFGISYFVSNNYAKIKINSDDDLPLKKTLTEHILVMLMKFLTKIKITTTIMYSQKIFHINELENNGNKFFGIKIMLNFGEAKVAREEFYGAENQLNLGC